MLGVQFEGIRNIQNAHQVAVWSPFEELFLEYTSSIWQASKCIVIDIRKISNGAADLGANRVEQMDLGQRLLGLGCPLE